MMCAGNINWAVGWYQSTWKRSQQSGRAHKHIDSSKCLLHRSVGNHCLGISFVELAPCFERNCCRIRLYGWRGSDREKRKMIAACIGIVPHGVRLRRYEYSLCNNRSVQSFFLRLQLAYVRDQSEEEIQSCLNYQVKRIQRGVACVMRHTLMLDTTCSHGQM